MLQTIFMLNTLTPADKKELINQVIDKVLGSEYKNRPDLIQAGLKAIIRANYLYKKNNRKRKFTLYAKHAIREDVVASYLEIDRDKAEKYAKLMGYLDAAMGNVGSILV